MKRFLAVAAAASVLALASCQDAETPLQPEVTESLTSAAAPNQALMGGPQSLADRWIVVFADQSRDPGDLPDRMVRGAGGTLHFTYRHAIKGFAATLAPDAVEGLRRNPQVAYVEPDADVILFQTTQTNATWGLDRVDQTDLPLDGKYTYYNNGFDANVYILDTGVRKSHTDFGGRVQYVPNGANGDFVGDGHGSAEDCHGHGTHVAGTAAGATWGVAKGAPIWAARVVNCSGGGQVSMAIAAVDWVTANANRPAVVNMSLGYGDVQSLRDAVENSIAAGVNYAVAAGNGNFGGIPQDACKQSPAGAPNAVTVGATNSSDSEASFSNYGPCVNILAPGVSITSAWHTNNTATNTISGTSMATPHVAGAMALYLTAHPSATPGQVAQALVDNATQGKISLHSRSRSNGTPNLLLYTLFDGAQPPPPENQPPVASFTYSCTDLACSFNGSGSYDPDGTIASYAWTFGDNSSGSGVTASKIYASAGTYNVTLTVTDNEGATGSASKSVTVSEPSSGDFTLSVSGRKVRGISYADLSWTPHGTSTNVDVFRNGAKITTTSNSGSYTDNLGRGASGTFTYKVCEAGSTITCSNEATVTF